MKKILVTTDFSDASKAGLRFAIQLATQAEVELVFFHCFQALIPTTVLQERVEQQLKKQGDAYLQTLSGFVKSIHRSMKIAPGKYHCVVVESMNPEAAILEYAEKHNMQFICMSTRGAGTLRKLVGTHTGRVLHRSGIPVLVVPHTYRRKPLHKLLYASDLSNFDKEMALVASFAGMLQAKADLTHFYVPGELTLDPENLQRLWQQKYPALDKVYLQRLNLDQGFTVQLGHLVKRAKPSLLVFFTHTNKTWFDKLFSTSRSESVAYVTTTPMLVYRKIG